MLMMNKASTSFLKRVWVLSALVSLAACSNNDEMVALQDYVQNTINRAPGPIEPIPEFEAYEAFTYSAASLRGPFDIPIDITALEESELNSDVRPDENRPRELLESFTLGNLKMVGSISRQGTFWALVQDSSGLIHDVKVGQYMGRNHGRVIATTESQIDMIEIVPTGSGGWMERPQTMVLSEED